MVNILSVIFCNWHPDNTKTKVYESEQTYSLILFLDYIEKIVIIC